MKRTPPQTHHRAAALAASEQIRRREVSRLLRRTDLSPNEEEIVDSLSRSLVDGLFFGPISEATAHVGSCTATHLKGRPECPRSGRS